ncbi:hypothetical protein HPB48_001671 [Haemaphysalis longicornis]|uniref:Uncharacterized protein n=1 Tax=Haemaphysalis longicornis TaxID=44386 RepID=A0A9J6FQ65_HAELO|nr:hypothetical protein HPB48_001671 [Haemaphysalis longicornis]
MAAFVYCDVVLVCDATDVNGILKGKLERVKIEEFEEMCRNNEDSLAKAAHSADTPPFEGATRGDDARHWIAKHAQQQHQTPSHADGGKRGRILSRTFCRADCSLLLRLRTRCASSTARRFFFGQADSPDCQHCGEVGNTEHPLLRCSRYSQERAKMLRRYAALGIACSTREELLFPSAARAQGVALTALLHFLHATDLATLL